MGMLFALELTLAVTHESSAITVPWVSSSPGSACSAPASHDGFAFGGSPFQGPGVWTCRRPARPLPRLVATAQWWTHHGQIDQIPAKNAIVAPAIRVGQQLARGHIEGCQRGDTANFITGSGRSQFNAPFQDDFKFDRLVHRLHHRPDTVLIGPHLSGLP